MINKVSTLFSEVREFSSKANRNRSCPRTHLLLPYIASKALLAMHLTCNQDNSVRFRMEALSSFGPLVKWI